MDPYVILPKETRFWLIIVPLVPSIICSLLVLHHYLFDRVQRTAHNNHVFIVIIGIGLIIETTVMPWMLHQYRLDHVWQRSPIFCEIWLFIDSGLFFTQMIFFAWASIERHILIFHDHLMRQKRWRILLHYMPLLLIFSYCMIWYGITFLFPPCQNQYFESDSICMWPCLWLIKEFSMYETFANQLFPNLMIIVFSLLLFVRVLWMKIRMRRTNQWRRNVKLATQLFSIISIYLLLVTPNTINVIIYWSVGRSETIEVLSVYFTFINYFPIMINPFICLFSSNELRTRLMDMFKCQFRRPRAVAIMTREMKVKTRPTVS